jgi:hypothetical protein
MYLLQLHSCGVHPGFTHLAGICVCRRRVLGWQQCLRRGGAGPTGRPPQLPGQLPGQLRREVWRAVGRHTLPAEPAVTALTLSAADPAALAL